MDYELVHHGILGQKWGLRRYQNEDGTYTEEGKERRGISRRDTRWGKRNLNKITKTAQKRSKKEIKQLDKEILQNRENHNKDGRVSAAAVNEYNRRLASLMTESVSDIRSPDGRAVAFVAKRGELGVHMAISDLGYDYGQLKNGVWEDGRIAYRKQSVNMG